MKVELAESWGEVAIICWVGLEEVRVAHKELKLDAEGEPLNEAEVLVALLNAASAAVASIPQAEQPPPEGETAAARKEREEKNAKALEDWTKERATIEAEEEEAMNKKAAEAQAAAAPPPEPAPEPAPEPQPQ